MRKKKGKRSYVASCQTCDNNLDFQIPDDLSRDLESRFYNYFDFGYRQSFFNNFLGDSFEFLINKINIVEKCIDVFFCSETGTYRSAHDFGDVSPSENVNREEVPNEKLPDEKLPDEEVPKDFGHLWVQCEECYGMNYRKYFFQTRLYVCEFCDCHVKLPSSLRIELSIDTGTWLPLDDLNQDMDAKPDLDPWTWDLSYEDAENTYNHDHICFKKYKNPVGEKNESKEKRKPYEEKNSNSLEKDSNNTLGNLWSSRGNSSYTIDTISSDNNNNILDSGNQGMHKNNHFARLGDIVENSNNKADDYNGPSIQTDTADGFHNPTASEDVGHIRGTGYARDNLHSVEHLNLCPPQDEDTSSDSCGRDRANSEGVDGHGSGDSRAHREGPGVQTNQDSAGYADLPDSSLCGEDVLFDFLDQKFSEAASTVLSKENCGLHIHPSGLPIRPIRILAGSDMLRNRMSILLDPHSLLLGNPRGSGSPLKKDKGICDSDSDSESDSESDHKSDDKEEKEFDSFLCIPFFIKNQELDLDSPCIPLIPTFISTKKTEKRTTDTRKGGDEWKKEWYSDEVKVASHHVNWWRQCKEEGTDDWYSDKVKNACQQLAEVDWWRHWNQEDWDNVKKILEDVEFVVEIEEEVERKPYVTRTFSDQDQTGLSEAIQTGFGQLNGIPVALGVMEFEFIGGSMGHTVGERITRLIEYASRLELPLIIVCASGGARLYEGAFSLMQMAKISSALHYFEKNNKNPFYISMLASPTTGGVTASFGMLGDIIISEPDAYIAFAGKRVIEETLKIEVPEGSQVAEVAFEKGLLDPIIPREMLKGVLSELLQLHNFLPLTPKIKGLLS